MNKIYTYELLGRELGWDYLKTYKECQLYPDLGFYAGKKRLFTEQDLTTMKEYAAKKRKYTKVIEAK